MPILELEFEVYCFCGNGLCGKSTEGKNRHSQYITVEPCEKCKDNSYEDGVSDGYAQCEKDNKER